MKVAFGTDAGVYPHGWNAQAIRSHGRWGLTPMQAIQWATIVNAAELLGWATVGAVAPGHCSRTSSRSTAIRCKDVTELERVTFVMKGGRVYRK